MANTYERVLNVIGKKPPLRQDFEIQGLLPWLRKKSKLFSTLKTECLKDIVRNCSVGKFQIDDVIIRQGEIGDCFYIILAGKISIFIINKDREGTGSSDEQSAYDVIGSLDSEGNLDRSKLGNFVTSLGSGFPFGEVALVSDDAVRTATIIAEEETDLLVVDRALYNRAVRDVLAAEFEEKQFFIKHNDMFSSWIPKYRKQLAMAMYKETFPYESVLVRQGDTVQNIYFIVSGQVEIRADINMHQSQYPKLYRLLEDEREKLIKEKRQRRQQPEVENIPPPLRKKDAPVKTLKMCYLGKNESLGEIEVLMDMETYMTSAICTERTEVLVLEMKHYERLFVKKHQRTIDVMRRRIEVKLNTRTSVLKEYDAVPLLKLLQLKLKLLHNPPSIPGDKQKAHESSVQIAEKLFFNHQGPLLDIDGPGSVFYMIRAREKSRLLKAHRKERPGPQQRNKPPGHVHVVRVPQSLIMAAQNSGSELTQAAYPEHAHISNENKIMENIQQLRGSEIDTVASSNNPDNTETSFSPVIVSHSTEDNKMQTSEVVERTNTVRASIARSFRRIQSADKDKNRHLNDIEQTGASSIKSDKENRSLPNSPKIHFDRSTTETRLQNLEEKVAEWLRKDNPRACANVAKLRRLQVEELEPPPKPGNKIVIRRRSRGSRSDSSAATGSGKSEMAESVKLTKSTYNSQKGSRSNFLDLTKEDHSLDRYRILLAK
ncbi:uncharacterized protein LOC127840150 [Dreissena polymorpha]|uniref:uncharacterized protein LOC127840150 n=1 Tax=Dreissena polymorpha TaxID=45954 RepID=UPI0022653E7A|nr:uncharacterized protein LOC127840150 [Dreissena polymorpha]